MKKLIQICVVVGFVGLMCGCTSGQDAEVKKNVTKLKETGNCQKCILYFANLKDADLNKADLNGAYLSRANLSGANLRNANLKRAKLQGADLLGANMENIRNLDSAIKCKTIFPRGEDNSGC